MNPFATRISSNSWVIPVSALTLVLGFMFSLAWLNSRVLRERIATLTPDQAARLNQGQLEFQQDFQKIQSEVAKLRKENTQLQNVMSKETDQTKVLNQALQESKMLAGLTEIEGQGVIVTLNDLVGTKIDAPAEAISIHDTDVLRVVNELWNAGAEAIAVNGNRVVTGTNFRCVGSVILVNNVRIAPPVKIQAIGDPQTMMGAINLPGGVFQELREVNSAMIQVEVSKKMRLPAFTGSTSFKFASPPKDNK